MQGQTAQETCFFTYYIADMYLLYTWPDLSGPEMLCFCFPSLDDGSAYICAKLFNGLSALNWLGLMVSHLTGYLFNLRNIT